MPETLKYRVENAQIVNVSRQIEVDGVSGEFLAQRAVFEALPLDSDGNVNPGARTFGFELPPASLSEFPEGTVISVTVSVDTPAPEVVPEA